MRPYARVISRPTRIRDFLWKSFNSSCSVSASDKAAAIFNSSVCKRALTAFEAMGNGRRRGVRGSSVRDLCARQRSIRIDLEGDGDQR